MPIIPITKLKLLHNPSFIARTAARNIFFSLASGSEEGVPGLKPNTNKLERFNVVVPDFKAKKFFFPVEKKLSEALKEMMLEISLAAVGGFRSKHDDCLDTISQLPLMPIWLPSESTNFRKDESGDAGASGCHQTPFFTGTQWPVSAGPGQ